MNQDDNWKRLFDQYTPEEQKKFVNDPAFKEASAADDFGKAAEIAAQRVHGQILSRKGAKLYQKYSKTLRLDVSKL